MKKIGIVGGLAWPSTADYYRMICTGANAHFRARGHGAPLPTPPMAIEHLNMAETRAARGRPDGTGWERFDAILRGALERLQASACDFAVIASNTPHARLAAVREGLDLPVISIIDASADEAARLDRPKALVLGTAVTMRSDLYAQALTARGIEANARLPEDRIDAIQKLIDDEFYAGATPAGRAELLSICREFAPDRQATTILLACTELPLAFPDHADDASLAAEGFTFVNTSAAHVKAALAEALGTSQR